MRSSCTAPTRSSARRSSTCTRSCARTRSRATRRCLSTAASRGASSGSSRRSRTRSSTCSSTFLLLSPPSSLAPSFLSCSSQAVDPAIPRARRLRPLGSALTPSSSRSDHLERGHDFSVRARWSEPGTVVLWDSASPSRSSDARRCRCPHSELTLPPHLLLLAAFFFLSSSFCCSQTASRRTRRSSTGTTASRAADTARVSRRRPSGRSSEPGGGRGGALRAFERVEGPVCETKQYLFSLSSSRARYERRDRRERGARAF